MTQIWYIKYERKMVAYDTRKLQAELLIVTLVIFIFCSASPADTFVNNKTREVLHGYAASQTNGSKTTVRTAEKGEFTLNLAQWHITPDRLGRNNKVIIFSIDEHIGLEIETQALEQAIVKAADEGPLFILIEIGTPGGQLDLVRRICGAITNTNNCQVFAFVKGGEYGGAISGGAAIAIACDKIYMTNNAVIGAATLVTQSGLGPKDIKKTFGETVGEKLNSAWRSYLASLAEQNGKPGLLAMAMADKDIEVIEVSQASRRLFIEPANIRPQQNIVHIWSKKGSLLTLTAQEAVKCGIADEVVDSRQELLQHLKAETAEIVIYDDLQKARDELKRAQGQVARIRKSLDLKVKQLDYSYSTPKMLNILRNARSDYQTLIRLARKYPDLKLDPTPLEDELNAVEAAYDRLKVGPRRRR